MFADNLDEFDSAREVAANLISEYTAAERPDYIQYRSGAADAAERASNDSDMRTDGRA